MLRLCKFENNNILIRLLIGVRDLKREIPLKMSFGRESRLPALQNFKGFCGSSV